jgi:type I restriction enzyme M protein
VSARTVQTFEGAQKPPHPNSIAAMQRAMEMAGDIAKIAGTYHAWREGKSYADMPGFCKAAKLDDMKEHNYVLTPGRYVGAADLEDDDVPFPERFDILKKKLRRQFAESEKLSETIEAQLTAFVTDD